MEVAALDFIERLHALCPEVRALRGAALSGYTTLEVGGPADYLVDIGAAEELTSVLCAAGEAGLATLILGNGSNVLVLDGGFRGVAVRLGKGFSRVSISGNRLTAQAGASLASVAKAAAQAGLAGLEFASGIPGTVGGATYMNAGAYGGEMSSVVERVTLLENGRAAQYDASEMRFGYRRSLAMDTGAVVLETVFRLAPGDRDAVFSKMRELNVRRRDKQPLEYPSAGSFFKRPQGHYAGGLIEAAGLKGYAVGGAQVSEKHAGFLINMGNATAQNFIDLMRYIQDRVWEKSGVRLEPEVRIVGSPV